MRASTDQVRHATVDAVEAARHRASGLAHTGADLVSTTIDRGASVVEGGIERVAEKAPLVSLGVAQPKKTHRLRTTIIALLVVVGILAVAKKVMAQQERASDDSPRTDPPSPTITSDEDTEPVASGSG